MGPWILHYKPRMVEVAARDGWRQLRGQSEIELDMLDALTRRFRQTDDALYRWSCCARWRHFVESRFMCVIAGWTRNFEENMRELFVGEQHIVYDVPNCDMLYFPVIFGHRWPE
ncbi:hypothetical protein ACP4OV_013621 [Aristida adscensionis]